MAGRRFWWWFRLKLTAHMKWRDYPDMMNRMSGVQSKLFRAFQKGEGLTPDQCRELAMKLGIPSWVPRREKKQ